MNPNKEHDLSTKEQNKHKDDTAERVRSIDNMMREWKEKATKAWRDVIAFISIGVSVTSIIVAGISICVASSASSSANNLAETSAPLVYDVTCDVQSNSSVVATITVQSGRVKTCGFSYVDEQYPGDFDSTVINGIFDIKKPIIKNVPALGSSSVSTKVLQATPNEYFGFVFIYAIGGANLVDCKMILVRCENEEWLNGQTDVNVYDSLQIMYKHYLSNIAATSSTGTINTEAVQDALYAFTQFEAFNNRVKSLVS